MMEVIDVNFIPLSKKTNKNTRKEKFNESDDVNLGYF
jgi:hypothetical protein